MGNLFIVKLNSSYRQENELTKKKSRLVVEQARLACGENHGNESSLSDNAIVPVDQSSQNNGQRLSKWSGGVIVSSWGQ